MRTLEEKEAGIGTRQAKEDLFAAIAQVAGALSSGRRLEIVDLLSQGERSVEEVASETSQSVANASHHLRSLARSGLVRSRKEGTRVYYRLAGPEAEALWEALSWAAQSVRDDLERLAAAYLGPLKDLEAITREDLVQRMSEGSVIVLDVRPVPEYQAAHIPGAVSVPIDKLDEAVGSMPLGTDVVAYCRGPYCVFAPAAVRALAAMGFHSYRLEEGLPQWRRKGFPIAGREASGGGDAQELEER